MSAPSQSPSQSGSNPLSDSDSDSEAKAFLNWIKALGESNQDLRSKIGLDSSRPILEIDDLCDGVALLDILATIDAQYFRSPHPPGGDAKDNWVLKMGTLKRLYKLIIQYYTEVLERQTTKLPIPDLESIARISSKGELNKLFRLVIGIIVQVPDKASEHIAAIQTLEVEDQNVLMIAMKETMESSRELDEDEEQEEEDDDDGDRDRDGRRDEENGHGNGNDSLEIENSGNHDSSYIKNLRKDSLDQNQARNHRNPNDENHPHRHSNNTDLDQADSDSDSYRKLYQNLLEENSNLQTSLEDSTSEKKDLISELKSLKMRLENESNKSNEINLKNEIERLKLDLRRTEDGLLEAENEVERLTKLGEGNVRKIEDLQKKADEVSRLKDQLDEYKHAADKAQRNENVIEKYKKKLEEGADVRRQLKVLEDQNAELVNKNAALEDEYKRVAQFKPLMDSYKSQISELEGKSSNLQRDLNSSRYETEQAFSKLKHSEESRAKEKEEMELYQERIKELEYGSNGMNRRKKRSGENGQDSSSSKEQSGGSLNGAEGLVATDESFLSEENDASLDDLEDSNPDLTGELDDALQGTTMTDLKIKVRKLSRELKEAKVNKADVSRILVLENLLDDSQRMKNKYENDYLKEHQSKLVLTNELENIRNGKSNLGDGPEAALALRRRLNETVEEIDELKKELTGLKVKNEEMEKELTIARSDLTLVNKDQLDILQSLRSSVDVEKQGLESTVSRIREELKNAEDRNRMLMNQVNGLLMEKVDLQSEGIGHREEALKRERNLGELRASLAGKALPKEAEDLLTSLQSSVQNLESQNKAIQEKLQKARQFIRQQDRLLKEKERQPAVEGGGASAELVKTLREENSILKREQALMSSAYLDQGTRLLTLQRSQSRSRNGNHPASSSNSTPSFSWLAQQRRTVASGLSYTSRR